MKLYYIFILALLVTTSCNNTEGESSDSDKNVKEVTGDNEEMTMSQKLSKRWVLVKRTTINEDKVIQFDENNSSVITFFEDNGYFRVYDSLTDQDKEHGVKRIEQRQSGQWEILNDKLILRFTHPDTVIVEEHEVQTLNDSELVLKSVDKNQINKYILKVD